MFEKLFGSKKVEPPPVVNGSETPQVSYPDKTSVLYRAWVVMDDGRIGYIDHYKSDGRFGVRPVNSETGEHYPNASTHWSMADRIRIPEELALTLHEFRAAKRDEIPAMYRLN